MIRKQETDKAIYYFVGPEGSSTCYLNLGNLANRKASMFFGFFPKVAKNRVKKVVENRNFVRKMVSEGDFADFLTEKEFYRALNEGRLPKRYEVHHYLPISMGGKYDENNLCIIDSQLHDVIHQKILDVIYREIHHSSVEDKEVFLVLPEKRNLLLTPDAATLFFSQEELAEIQAKKKSSLKRFFSAKQKTVLSPQNSESIEAATPVKIDTRVTEEMYKRLRFVEYARRALRGRVVTNAESVRSTIETQLHIIRKENTYYRHERAKRIKTFNDDRSMRDRVPLTRKEKALISVKKIRRHKTKRWYPHLCPVHRLGRWYQ